MHKQLFLLTWLIFTFGFDINAQLSKSQLKSLIKAEKEKELRAINGNNSEIQIISDSIKVNRIKQEIDFKLKQREIEAQKVAKGLSLCERYKLGDKSVIPEIIKILTSDNLERKKEIYYNLNRQYNDPKSYKITEPELIKAILNNINLDEDERFVIQIAGYSDLEGFNEVFEDRLLSGETTDLGRLVFWLGKKGQSIKTVDYIENLIFDYNLDLNENHYVITGLEYFAKNGDDTIKKRVLDISLRIYYDKKIGKDRFDELKTQWSSSNPANNLLDIFFTFKNDKVRPIIEDAFERKIKIQQCLIYLIELDGSKYQDKVLSTLKNPKTYYYAIEPAKNLYLINRDNETLITILEEFERQKEHSNYTIDRIADLLAEANSAEINSQISSIIKEKTLANAIESALEVRILDLYDIANELFTKQIIQTPISKNAVELIKQKSNSKDIKNQLYYLLDSFNLIYWFDAEVGVLPVPYDDLINDLLLPIKDSFAHTRVFLDAKMDKEYNVEYSLYLEINDIIYYAQPEDFGDWYDVDLAIRLMNLALKNAEIQPKYNIIDTGDQTVQLFFGPEKPVQEFVEKYNL